MSKVQEHISKLFNIIHDSSRDKEESLDLLLTFIAYQMRLDPGMVSPTLRLDVWEKLKQTLDMDLLKSEPYQDHFGLFWKKKVNPSTTYYLSPSKIIMETKKIDQQAIPKYRAPILDKACGTGGFLLELARISNGAFLYHGVTNNKLAYHIALVQMALNDIPSRILLRQKDQTRFDIQSRNWKYANSWIVPKEHSATWEQVSCNP